MCFKIVKGSMENNRGDGGRTAGSTGHLTSRKIRINFLIKWMSQVKHQCRLEESQSIH